jgi:hypothetical protein
MESFEQFRQIVLQDRTLQERLSAATDHHTSVDLVVCAGGEMGCHFTAEDVQAALLNSRRDWFQSRMVS